MTVSRRVLLAAVAVFLLAAAGPARAGNARPEEVLRTWYKVALELTRHTATYSPPVASRTFAYLGVTAFEAAAGGSGDLQSLAGQLNGLNALPAREAGKEERTFRL